MEIHFLQPVTDILFFFLFVCTDSGPPHPMFLVIAYTLYRKSFWQSYQEVNALFCREIIRLVEPDDWVWVQDYQLMLLPEMLRQELPRLHIGYFHHIPFPSYELFRILPERAEILKGLLGADFIAFHTHDYMRHFISAAERVLHMDFSLDETRIGSRIVRVDALPMGINYDHSQCYLAMIFGMVFQKRGKSIKTVQNTFTIIQTVYR